MTTPPSWPLDSPEHLAEALREQGAAPEEIDALAPVLLRFSAWQAPQPTAADTQDLLARLTPFLPAVSPVRQAIRDRHVSHRSRLAVLLEIAGTQVSILHPAFWLLSVAVMLVGAAAVLSGAPLDQSLLLRAIGPCLAYLGTTTAFRGAGLRVLEFELACPPSSIQLVIARLVIVLSYDVTLGLFLSLALWAHGTASFLTLTLHWLMPLLLVAGLALLLSLYLAVQAAAALSYGGWLALLVLDSAGELTRHAPLIPLSAGAEGGIGLIGLALLAIALSRLRADVPRLLPRS
jgi:hypothetical protein